MPVDRHRIGAEQRYRIGRLDEGNIVAHQDADAVALPHAESLQAAGDAAGAVGDLGVSSGPFARDDAEEERGCGGHRVVLEPCKTLVLRSGFLAASRRMDRGRWWLILRDAAQRCAAPQDEGGAHTSANRGARFSRLARTASVWFGAPISCCCSTDSANSAGPGSTERLFSMRLAARIACGLLPAISRATAIATLCGSSQIRVARP